jgi:hypothetical protein
MGVTGTRVNSLTDLPSPHVVTDRFLVSSGGVLKRTDAAFMHGGLLTRKTEVVKPVASDFNTWLNQNSATLTDNGDALSLEYANTITSTAVAKLAGRYRSLPSGSWDVQVGTRRMYFPKEFLISGIFLRESATNKIELFGYGHSNGDCGLIISKYSDADTYVSDRRQSFEWYDQCWFRVRKINGPDGIYAYYYSCDGVCWAEFTNQIAMNSHFTTGPDQWGFMIQPVNNGATDPRAVRLDVFDWDESTNTDIYESFPHNYNDCGLYDRQSRITITSNLTFHSPVSPTGLAGLVDGSYANGNSPFFDPTGQSSGLINFEFYEPKIIDQARLFASNTTSHGTWKWQGSNDGSSYTDISATFTLAGDTGGNVCGDLTANTTAYLHYRLFQTAGTVSDSPFLREFEFRIMKG